MSSRGHWNSRKSPAVISKDLCLYIVEYDESSDGGVQEEMYFLIRQCVMDKVFSENPDHIAICRSDSVRNIEFVRADWVGLRKAKSVLHGSKLANPKGDGKGCIDALLEICEVINSQSTEDTYELKKILFFGHLNSEEIEEKDIVTFAETVAANGINISFILTDEELMNERQKNNLQILNKVLSQNQYEQWALVTSYKKGKRQIMNTSTKKSVKPTSWNVVMEIGPDITISVGGYLATRKNKVGEMTKALLKSAPAGEIRSSQLGNTRLAKEDAQPGNSRLPDEDVRTAEQTSEKTVLIEVAKNVPEKEVMIEVAKNVTEKEVVWKEKDGTVVADEDIGKAFFYGDKMVPFNELENEDAYRSGGKCLKVLVFCSPSNIYPAYQLGDGTTLFYPAKNDAVSSLKFDALLKALSINNKIAIVRKVYRCDSRVNLGVLAPDMNRMCLVFSEICCADDVSVPHFASLIKEVRSEDEGITKQEELIDDLIAAMSIDEFEPPNGPCDPAVAIIRESVACQILDKGNEKKPSQTTHGIDIFFEKLVLKDDLLGKLKESFPLKVNKEEGDRPSGGNIFRKRHNERDENLAHNDEKKIKIDNCSGDADQESGVGTLEDDNGVDIEDLLDEL